MSKKKKYSIKTSSIVSGNCTRVRKLWMVALYKTIWSILIRIFMMLSKRALPLLWASRSPKLDIAMMEIYIDHIFVDICEWVVWSNTEINNVLDLCNIIEVLARILLKGTCLWIAWKVERIIDNWSCLFFINSLDDFLSISPSPNSACRRMFWSFRQPSSQLREISTITR